MPRNSRPLTACVTGGTGAIGPVLVEQLVEAGYRVKVLARHQPTESLFPDSVALVLADICDRDSLHQALAGVDLVFHLAAKLHIVDPTPDLAAEYHQINVVGTQNLIQAAQAQGVQRVIFFSTIAVYGASQPGTLLTEDSPAVSNTLYAQTKCQAEQIVLAAKDQTSGQPLGVVLRLAAVYGSRIKGNYARLVTAIEKRRFVRLGAGQNRRTLIHEVDLARAVLLTAEHPAAAGHIYNVTDGQVHTLQEILRAIYQGLGRALPGWSIPILPVRLAITVIGWLFFCVGQKAPVQQATIDKFLEDVAVSGQRLQDDLAFQPQVSLQAGWAMILQGIED